MKAKTPEQIADWAELNRKPNPDDLADEVLQIAKSLSDLPLSVNRRKILAVKLLPNAAIMTETAKAKLAGVSRPTWYDTINDPAFIKISQDYLKGVIGSHVAELWAAHLKDALAGDKDIRRQILEAVGLLGNAKSEAPAAGTTVQGDVHITQIFSKMADEEADQVDAAVAAVLNNRLN